MDQDTPDEVAPADVTTAGAEPMAELLEQPREALPRAVSSDRILWVGAGVALLAHVLPFVYFAEPTPLGEGVLTEAIAVELVDKATLEGKDQTPATPPAPASPPPQPAPQAQTPPGPPQTAQKQISPAPPPAAAPKPPEPKPEADTPPPVLPAFKGDGDSPHETKDVPKKAPSKPKPVEPDQAEHTPAAKPQPPQPKRPPPQPAQAAHAPAAPAAAAKASPPRSASAPAQARSGEVTKFAKEVVAALAKAKPNAPGIKGKVTVTVVVAFGGGVRLAKITGSSGREDLDKLALEAAKKAPLPAPPPDVSTDDLFYDVEYSFQ